MDLEKVLPYLKGFINEAVAYIPKIILALIVVWIGFMIAKRIGKAVQRALDKRDMDEQATYFIAGFVSVSIRILVIISAASILGVATSSFVAAIAAAGLAVGLALQGSLSNFAGGILIFIFKPFRVGDFIKAQSHSGTVREIRIFSTVLVTPQNETIFLPNGSLSNGSIVNVSMQGTRRLDLTFGIGYGDDIDKAKNVIQSVVDSYPHLLKEEPITIIVTNLGDSSVDFAVRVWPEPAKYWDAHAYLLENMKKAFDREGINIPYPTMDVNVSK